MKHHKDTLKDLKSFKKDITTKSYNDNISHEKTMLSEGIERYNKKKETNNKTIPFLNAPVRSLFEEALPKGVEALKKQIQHDKDRPKPPRYVGWLDDLPIEQLVLQGLSDAYRICKRPNGKPITAAVSIGQVAIMLKEALGFNTRQTQQFKRLSNRAKAKYSQPERRMDYLKYLVLQATKQDGKNEDGSLKSALYGFKFLAPNSEKFDAEIGMQILKPIIDSCGIFKIESNYGRGNGHFVTDDVLTLTEEAYVELDKQDKLLEWQKPRYKPMLHKPAQVGLNKYNTTGYHDSTVRSTLQPVKKMKPLQKEAINKAIDDGSMKAFWQGENYIQNVPYVLDLDLWKYVVQPCIVNDIKAGDKFPRIKGMKLLPPQDWADEEAYPDHEFWDDKVHKLYAKYKDDVEKYNRTARSNYQVYTQDRDIIEEIGTSIMWLPQQPDNRGRTYAVPHLNPQREERISALFRFAEKLPLGEDGDLEIAVHLANCGAYPIGKNPHGVPEETKVDKVIEDIKIWWLEQNWYWIHDTVIDFKKGSHFKHHKWKEADKPFKFLQAAIEYYNLLLHVHNGGEVEEFLSNLPCALDSSSSGIQIYACMLYSQEDAKISNLIYEEGQLVANDVYQMIADAITVIIDHHIEEYEGYEDCREAEWYKFAMYWKAFGVSRKVVKRPIMTSLYSATRGGHTIMIMEDTIKPLTFEVLEKKRKEHPFGDDENHWKAASYLALLISMAIEQQLQAPFQAMNMLRSLAAGLAEEGKFVEYTNPTGFPLVNEAYEEESRQIQLYLTDAKLSPTKYQPHMIHDSDEVSISDCVSKICPNFVHTLDSALLILATIEFIKRGGTSILVNHDSFSTHPSTVQLLKRVLQDTRVEIFTKHRPLHDIIRHNKSRFDNLDNVPEAPKDGSFNITEELPKAVFADS